jgi:hypothetical protein
MGAAPAPSDREPPRDGATQAHEAASTLAKARAGAAGTRGRRVVRWAVLGLVGSLLATPVALWAAVAALESERGRAWIVETAAEGGVVIDYRSLSLRPLDGAITIEGLRFPSAPAHAPIARDWLAIERIELALSPSALLGGQLHVESALVTGVHAQVVLDADGRDSVSLALAGLAGDEEPAPPPSPLSRTLVDLALPLALRIDALVVRDVRAELHRTRDATHTQHVVVEGLELEGAARGDRGPLELALTLRSPEGEGGTRVRIEERGPEGDRVDELAQQLSLRVATEGSDAIVLEAGSRLLPGGLLAALDLAPQLLDTRATVHFDPAHGRTRIELERLDVVGGAARGTLTGELDDDAVIPRLERADLAFDLDAWAALVPSALGVRSEDGHLALTAQPGTEGRTRVEVRGTIARGAVAGVEVEGVSLVLDADLTPERATLQARLPIATMRVPQEAGTTVVEGLELTLDAPDLRAVAGEPEPHGDVSAALSARGLTADLDGAQAVLDGVRLDARATLRGRAPIDPTLELVLGRSQLAAGGARAELAPSRVEVALQGLDPTLRTTDVGSVRTRVRSEAFRASTAHRSVEARAPEVSLDVVDLRLDAEDPRASRGEITLQVAAPTLATRDERRRVAIHGLRARLSTPYAGRAPSTLRGTVGVAAVRATDLHAADLHAGDLHAGDLHASERHRASTAQEIGAGELGLTLSELVVDTDVPLRSRGRLRASGRLAPFEVDLDLALRGGDGEGSATLRVEPARALASFVSLPEGLDLDRATISLDARGQWRGLASASPALEHHATLDAHRVSWARPDVTLAMPHVRSVMAHEGRGTRHEATLSLTVAPPTLDGVTLDRPFTLEARGELDGVLGRLEARADGPGGLAMRGDANVAMGAGEVRHDERLALAGLGVLGLLIPAHVRDAHPLDVDAISLELRGEGSVSELDADEPLLRQLVWGTVRGLRYHPEAITIASPEVQVEVDLERRGARVGAEVRLAHDRVEIEDPVHHHLTVHGLTERVAITSSEAGRVGLEIAGRIERVETDFAPAYPMEDLTLGGHVTIDGGRSVEIEDLVFENPRGGTRVALTKTMSRAPRGAREGDEGQGVRRGDRMLLRGQLEQDLARIDAAPDRLRARGHVRMPLTLESGDGSLFRVHASLELDDVDVAMPGLALDVRGIRAVVPVEEAFEWTAESGLVVVTDTDRNPFERVRFQDVQPFLGEQSGFEVARLRWGALDAGPIHGSLQVDRSIFAIDALRIERGDARITGQLRIDYARGAERIDFRGNVTGLRLQGSDEPLDANAALTIDPTRLGVDGRVQIVRIAGTHLTTLLDLLDPYRENASFEGLRSALDYGHPERVSLGLHEGLLSMHVELGGALGSLLQVGEIRGVALGPFLDRHVAPYLPSREESP